MTQTWTALPTVHRDVFVSDDGRGWRQVGYLWLKIRNWFAIYRFISLTTFRWRLTLEKRRQKSSRICSGFFSRKFRNWVSSFLIVLQWPVHFSLTKSDKLSFYISRVLVVVVHMTVVISCTLPLTYYTMFVDMYHVF